MSSDEGEIPIDEPISGPPAEESPFEIQPLDTAERSFDFGGDDGD